MIKQPRRSTSKSIASLLLPLIGLSAAPAFSAIVYWDGDGVGTVGGGIGTWDTTSLRWSTTFDGNTYQAWNNANGDDAVFSVTGTAGPPAGAVAAGAAITANSLTFTVTGYTVGTSGAALALSAPTPTLTVDVQTTGQAILNAQYNVGIATIVKNGTGLLSSGVSQSAFAGKWIVNGGILSLPGDLRLGVVPAAVVPDLVTLDGAMLRTSQTDVSFNVNRGVTLGINGGGFDSNHAGILRWNGPITGILGGSFTKRGTGNVALTNNSNNYDGTTIVTDGRLTVGAANALGTVAGDTEVGVSAGLIFDGAATNFTINEPIRIAGVGEGADGGAIFVRNGANVTFGGPIILSSDASVTVDGSSTATYSNTNSFTSSAGQSLTLNGDALTTGGGGTISGAISLDIGGLNKTGPGKWTVAGANVYTGNTNVIEGTLIVSGSITGTLLVDVTGTLGGGGSVILNAGSSVAVHAGGKLAPGNTGAGNLTIALSGGGGMDINEAIFGPGSQALAFELAAPSASDKISVFGGALNIGSGALEFDDFVLSTLGGFNPQADYVLFDGNMPVLGTLGSNLSGTVNGFLAQLQLGDSGRDIVLHVVPEPSAGLALIGGMVTLLGLRRRRS